jgi:hypothetical protein
MNKTLKNVLISLAVLIALFVLYYQFYIPSCDIEDPKNREKIIALYTKAQEGNNFARLNKELHMYKCNQK